MSKRFGGKEEVAKMLNDLDTEMQKRILSEIEKEDPRLANDVKDLMLGFEDLIRTEDQSLAILLQAVDQKKLALAMRNASPSLKDHIFKNLTKRAGGNIVDLMNNMGPQKLSIVHEAQKEIIEIARALETDGKIRIKP